MTIAEFKAKYKQMNMSSREVRELISANSAFKREISHFYCDVLKRRMNLRCNDCYMDAYIEIMTTPTDKLIAMAEREFELRAGALLFDVVSGDRTKTATAQNLTDELAMYHLTTNPSYIRFFSKYPSDWEERVKLAKNRAGTDNASKVVQVTKGGEKTAQNAVKRVRKKRTTNKTK